MARLFRRLNPFPETRVQFQAPTQWFTAICNYSFRGSDIHFWVLWAPGIQVVHVHTYRQWNIHKMEKYFKEDMKLGEGWDGSES